MVIDKLRQFQSLGHLAVLLIGNFSRHSLGVRPALPECRPPLTPAEVLAGQCHRHRKKKGQPKQVMMVAPLLEGLDGGRKM